MELFIRRLIFCILMFLDVFIIIAVLSFIISFFKIDISKYVITSNKLPKEFDGFKILHLSDLHNKELGKNNKNLINEIEKQSPDIIVITGDIVSSNSKNFDTCISLIKTLSEKYPIYYVMGNHEQRLPYAKQVSLLGKLAALNVHILNNKETIISKEEKYLNIYGLTQPLNYYNNYLKSKDYSEFTSKDLTTVFPSVDKNNFNILLTHNPLYFDSYSSWGADLVFSGHIHGGLIRLPIIGGIVSPERSFFPKYSGGKYTIDSSEMIVNRGLGSSTINLRIFNNPEICVIELKAN